MSIPKDVKIPKGSSQFMNLRKLDAGKYRIRVLSDMITGWEG